MSEQNYLTLLKASVNLARQRRLIVALKAENEMLRSRLRIAEARRLESTSTLPALLRRQAE